MQFHGKSVIAGTTVDSTGGHFSARGNLARFEEATEDHVSHAFDLAEKAFHEFRKVSPDRRAAFLERICDEIEALGDDLLTTASIETALPIAERLVAERRRTVTQIRMFASLIREGSWVDARIDREIAD